MGRSVSWLVLGCLCLSVVGCEDPKQPIGPNNGAGAPAPVAPPPGMAPGAAPGPGAMPAGMGMPAAPAAPAAPPVVVRKDPLVFLPANVTFALGGQPAAIAKSPNKISGSFLSQFAPLTSALTRIGLPPTQIESFWAAGNADFTEQALCVVTTTEINQEALRQALGGDKIPKSTRVWPLPGDAAATYALAIADSRTVIIGRKTTVESALRKSPALLIKQGLGTIDQNNADFWMAGDSAAAHSYFAGGLPLLGRYRPQFEELKAFGFGMILDGKPLVTNNPGTAGQPGMMPGAPGMGMAPGGMPAGNTTTSGVTGDQFGVIVMGGFLFESDAAAIKVKTPLDLFLATAALHRVSKSSRYIPDLLGTGGANGANGQGAMMGAPGMMAGGPGGPNSQPGLASKVGVIPEPVNAAATPPIDYRLRPVTPPPPQVVAAAGAPDAGQPGTGAANPNNPVPSGFQPIETSQNSGMNPGNPGMMPGMTSGSVPGVGQWAKQTGNFLQFAYRFDARDENIAFTGHLLHALGTTPFGDPLSAGPLASIHKSLQEALSSANAAGGNDNGFSSRGTSWMVHLLPFMGHHALYKRLNPKWPLTHPENFKLSHAVIPEFLNPADPRQQWTGAPYSDMGLTHFVGMSGVEEEGGPLAATLDRNDPKAGIFGYKQIATPEMITDGQSQTIMMLGSGELASPWAVGGGATIRGARPNSFAPKSGFGSAGGPKAGSFVLFADGSVRFVAAEVDPQVFNAMSTMHGKDTVDLPALQAAGTVIGK
ncbi:MAG: DUF1559 domain-containing protein [Planctomycetota bacterium]